MLMSSGNLRDSLPESNSIISGSDIIIVNTPEHESYSTKFSNLIFSRENFKLSTDLDNNLTLSQQITSDILDYVSDATDNINIPEILCLYYKEFTNGTGAIIGQQTIATTNISLNFFQVSTIVPEIVDENLQFSEDASGLENALSDDGIDLSPGIYKVECTGSFTLAGPAGSFDISGNSIGNGDRGYLVLEIYNDTEPNESLLVSTPIIDYAPDITITQAPTSWCGTQDEWEFFQRTNYETSTTHCAHIVGFISVCKVSNIKLKAHTAGSYIIGYPNPDSSSELPPSLYSPIQLIFEKITDDPFEFDITTPETNILTTVPQTRPVSADTPVTEVPVEEVENEEEARAIRTGRVRSGERIFKRVGPQTWIVPNGVDRISLVAVGAGGGGAATNDLVPNGGNGGDLRWRNNIKVKPGTRIWINIGEGGTSYRANRDGRDTAGEDGGITEIRIGNKNGAVLLRAAGGRGGRVGNSPQPENRPSTPINRDRNIGGGNGGRGGRGAVPSDATAGGGGGGAGGYSGNGGNGGDWDKPGRDGRGGAGGGGSGGKGTGTAGGGGGGVGLFGTGVNGQGGSLPASRKNGNPGLTGSRNRHKGIDLREKVSFGYEFGGGGAGKGEFMGEVGNNISSRHGGNGAVRIIWGPQRNFPNNAN